MKIKWRFTGLFIVMNILSLFLFWLGINISSGFSLPAVGVGNIILALLLPVGVVYFYFNNYSRRMAQLIRMTGQISEGNFGKIHHSDSRDELGQIFVILNDLSRQVEIALKKGYQEANKMDAILTSMQEGVIILDQVGRIVIVNPAAEKFFNCHQDEVKLKYLAALAGLQELDKPVAKGLAGEYPESLEVTLQQLFLWVQVSPILDKYGRSIGAVIVCYDTSELKRLEHLRTEFVANVSHELRTPLTSIKGFVETLLDGAAENPVFRERFLKIVQAETLRLQRLIEDLLTLSRIENRNKRPESAPGACLLLNAYKKIQPIIENYAEAKDIDLKIDLPPDLPLVAVGEDLLSQVLLNLLENAVKYTAQGYVCLSARLEQEDIHIEFRDTGSGIPAESLPRIFDRFYRVDKARSREQGGTGLGLSIVKHIIEGAGGTIEVSSQLGVGTVFTCVLPAVKQGVLQA
ncbi:MAG TPA: ATP-binding protein [Desulfitobacteriaceae bacterium]|nr:ATP-binding protein [Desulfitobacteriaceae bacterium]